MNLGGSVEAQITSPAFSQNIESINPGAPFITCLQGQFEPLQQNSLESVPHNWFIKVEQSGTLTLEVRAFSVNPAEFGSIIARLFDGTTSLGSIEVTHPNVAGAETIGFMSASVTPKIYRLEVVRKAAAIGTPEAHHYKLGFSGVPVDVGVNSPTFPWFEPETQTLQVNLAAGEGLNLTVSAGMPPTTPTATEEVSRRDNLQVLSTTTSPLPLIVTVSNPYGGAAGTLVLRIGSQNSHYMLDKNGQDRGIYFDTCQVVQPPPPAPGTPRTIGYWKNHEEETTAHLPQALANYLVDTFLKANAVLDEAHAKNAYEMLAAQMLAARLNVASNVPHACIDATIEEAKDLLVFAGYMGPGTTLPPADKAAVNAVKDKLDAFNNNGCP